MEPLSPNDLVDVLRLSSQREHELLTWTTNKLNKKNEFNVQTTNHIKIQLRQLIDDFANDREFTINLSLVMCRQISSLYTWSMKSLADNDFYDDALYLASILCEEDLSQAKTKKKSKTKSYAYSPAKFLSVVCLIHLIEFRPQQLASLLPLVLPDVLKNIKKAQEKEKYMHAVFLTQLMLLVSVAFKNSAQIDPAITTKFTKIAKHALDRVKTDDQMLPKSFLNAIIHTYAYLYKDLTFVETQSSGSPLETLKTKFFLNGYGLYGLSSDELRQETATCLGEVLNNWCSERKVVSLNDVLDFFSDIFVTIPNRSVRAGTFEALAHFLGITLSEHGKMLEDSAYLHIISRVAFSIFTNRAIKEQKLDNISKYMKFFETLHLLFLRYFPESGRLLMLYSIFDCEKDNSTCLLEDREGEVFFPTIIFLKLAGILIDDLSSMFITNSRNLLVMKSKLLELSTSNNFQIRVHASQCLQTYLRHAPHLIPDILQSSLDSLTNELFSTSALSFSKCHGYTFLLANLFRVCDPEYVPSELVMRVNIFATTILKDHPPSGGLASYNKQLFSWILLCGFMNYSDMDLLRVQSSQLFLFWKGILAHSFSYRDEDELYKNIELRNHALACLLAYLNRIDLNADIAKQVFFLLTKCSTFNNSIQLKNKSIDNVLLQNENRILQTYLKVHEFVKKEFNSAVLILIVKNFADPNLYYEAHRPVLDNISVSADGYSRRNVTDSEGLNLRSLLCDESGFGYGLSSKIYDFNIDELNIKTGSNFTPRSLKPYEGDSGYWFSPYESEVYTPISSVLSYDSLILLYGAGGYTSRDKYSPRVTTSIVNSSIEVFSLIFPYLNEKIQYSVLESMNSSLFSKKTVTMRSIAIASNCCVALLGALEIIQGKDLKLQPPVANLMLKMLKGIPFLEDEFMTRLKAECAGLIISSTTFANDPDADLEVEYFPDVSDVMIKDILDHDDPFSRVFNILSICRAFKQKRRKLNFRTTLDLVESLIKDPHPIVHTWSVEALSILIEGASILDVSTASRVLHLLEHLVLDEKYGKNSTAAWGLNYSLKFDSQLIMAKTVFAITQRLGPELEMLSPSTMEEFNNLVCVMAGSCDSIEHYYAICTVTHLSAFKMLDIVNPIEFVPSAMTFLERAFSISLYPCSNSELFNENIPDHRGPYNELLIEAIFEFMGQLVRLDLIDETFEDVENTVWRYFSIFSDCKGPEIFLNEWFVHTCSLTLSWSNKLYNLFFMTRQKLANLDRIRKGPEQDARKTADETGGFLSRSEIIDVEEKAFTSEFGAASKVDALSWRFRLFILDLMARLFNGGASNKLVSSLGSKLQKVIKLCFTASAMKNPHMKRRGIELLGAVLETFLTLGHSTGISSLHEEEAHIISALMPAFEEGSSPVILPIAINTCAQYLCLCYSDSKRSSRAVEILVDLLAKIMEKPDTFSCGEVKVCTPTCKSKVEVAVLNSWALVTLAAVKKQNSDLIELSRPFWNTLTPLWIIFLREFISSRNVETSNSAIAVAVDGAIADREMLAYESVWINFTEAICAVYSESKETLLSCLTEDDLESFVFVVYAHSLQHLTLNFEDEKSRLRTLDGIRNIVTIDTPCAELFSDDNIEEAVEVFERIVLTGSSLQLFKLVDVIEGLALRYFETLSDGPEFLECAGKIYLLLRVVMMIITFKLPFLKGDVAEQSLRELGSEEVSLLNKCFTSISKLLCKFPVEFRMDLSACMLFVAGQVFESNERDTIAPGILPLLEQITNISDPSEEEKNLIVIFFKAEKDSILKKLPTDLSLSVLFLLQGFDRSSLTDSDVNSIVDIMKSSLIKGTCPITTLSLFGVYLDQRTDSVSCREIVRRFVAWLFAFLQDKGKPADFKKVKLGIELLMSFTKTICEKSTDVQASLLTLVLSVLLSIYGTRIDGRIFIVTKITELFQLFTDTCKNVVTHRLDDNYKNLFSKVVAASSDANRENPLPNSNQIQLRSFV
ncbi:AP-1 complex accessory protein LAA1 LALA0_S11e03026g [Lachancea lanzarotensis]|uniref:LALA0S11e03026g1_1 n=1 Tax=Lachancea lanzarotensis TaxID=1245769 RepID=A0A0C7MWL0_9SACH|nr:uncharacterized protein LALA0_S11e03026g [Lachancea lanzarotensis]CEP64391.1 LALA0S11e03026g1_1 [Lachancea lanzarotensis]